MCFASRGKSTIKTKKQEIVCLLENQLSTYNTLMGLYLPGDQRVDLCIKRVGQNG